MRCTSKQYRYPNTVCHLEHGENTAPIEIPVNRKQRTGTVRMVREVLS
jgi:hypothetical protein